MHRIDRVLSLCGVAALGAAACLGIWVLTSPKIHAERATVANENFAGQWKPLVKMIKKWNQVHGGPVEPGFLIEAGQDIQDVWDTHRDHTASIDPTGCRNIQDTAYLPRRHGPRVPGLLLLQTPQTSRAGSNGSRGAHGRIADGGCPESRLEARTRWSARSGPGGASVL